MNSDLGDQRGPAPSPEASRRIASIRRQTMGVQIHGYLRRDIISGYLLPRATLSEQELAQRFGVSRTPVREALIKLAEENSARNFSAIWLVRITDHSIRSDR